MRKKYKLRLMDNRIHLGDGKYAGEKSWDIMEAYKDGEGFICEFPVGLRALAGRVLKFLNSQKAEVVATVRGICGSCQKLRKLVDTVDPPARCRKCCKTRLTDNLPSR